MCHRSVARTKWSSLAAGGKQRRWFTSILLALPPCQSSYQSPADAYFPSTSSRPPLYCARLSKRSANHLPTLSDIRKSAIKAITTTATKMMSCNTEGTDISKYANQGTISQPRTARRKFDVNFCPASSSEDRPIAPLHCRVSSSCQEGSKPCSKLRRIYARALSLNGEFTGLYRILESGNFAIDPRSKTCLSRIFSRPPRSLPLPPVGCCWEWRAARKRRFQAAPH